MTISTFFHCYHNSAFCKLHHASEEPYLNNDIYHPNELKTPQPLFFFFPFIAIHYLVEWEWLESLVLFLLDTISAAHALPISVWNFPAKVLIRINQAKINRIFSNIYQDQTTVTISVGDWGKEEKKQMSLQKCTFYNI